MSAEVSQTFPINFERSRYEGLFVAVFSVPFVINDYWVNSLVLPFMTYAIAAIGLNILVGYCGQVPIGTGKPRLREAGHDPTRRRRNKSDQIQGRKHR